MARAWFLVLAILLCLPQTVGAADPPRGLVCKPALSVFCRNIHVGCSGVTGIPTTRFEVVVADGRALLDFEGSKAPLAGQVSGSGDLVIRLAEGRDWVRIKEDGRFSHRTYRDGRAAMSYGTCRPRPAG